MKSMHSMEFSPVTFNRPVSYQILIRDSLGRVVTVRDFFDVDDLFARQYYEDLVRDTNYSYELYRIELLDSSIKEN